MCTTQYVQRGSESKTHDKSSAESVQLVLAIKLAIKPSNEFGYKKWSKQDRFFSSLGNVMSSIVLKMDHVSILAHTRHIRGNRSVITGKFSQIQKLLAGIFR